MDESTPTLPEPDEPNVGIADEGGSQERRRPTFSEDLRRVRERLSFLLQTVLWLILDGLFLLASFYWFRFINTSVHQGDLEGWQADLFEYCRFVLEATPLALVVVHTLLDFVGAVKRMVARR